MRIGFHLQSAMFCLVATAVGAASIGQSSKAIVALAFDPGTHTLLKADPDAVYERTAGRHEWEAVRLPPAAIGRRISAVAIAPGDRPTFYVAGSEFGVLRSSDRGRTWDLKGAGLPRRSVDALAIHASRPSTLYAHVPGKGIFRSEDAGDHWRLMDAGPRGGIVRLVHSDMPGSMQTGWLFAATAKGVARSMDCFCGWRDAGALGRAVGAIAYDPREPKRIYAASDAGLFVSENGGERWLSLRAPGRLGALVATADGRLIAADASATLFESDDHGVTWRRIDE